MSRDTTCHVGLALSGGGARGLAHIGVLKVLEREGVAIDCLAGTSMGGIIAAGYAAGMSAEAMEAEALHMSQARRLLELVDRALPRRGLVKGERVQAYLAKHLGAETTFADLRLPLALVSVDLATGQEVVLAQGRVVEAVRATIAIPGLLAPVETNGYRLVDGGVLNNLPADVVRHMGARVAIAVDVGIDPDSSMLVQLFGGRRLVPDRLVHIVADAQRALTIMQMYIQEQRLRAARPDVIIRPQLGMRDGLFTGFTRPREIIAAGEAAAMACLPEICQAIERGTNSFIAQLDQDSGELETNLQPVRAVSC